jgi:hypothetical protein
VSLLHACWAPTWHTRRKATLCVTSLLESMLLRTCRAVGLQGHRGMADVPFARGGYKLTPLPIVGAEVTGIDLKEEVSLELRGQIKEDVQRHVLAC